MVNAGTVGGLTLSDGATMDISSLAGSFSLDDNAISFADGATILVDVGTRRIRSTIPVLSWTEAPANLLGLKFLILSGGKAYKPTTGNDGLYLQSGCFVISLR